MSRLDSLIVGCCRASYYISLLGLKIPCALLARASHSRYMLGFIGLVWVPFLLYAHTSLLPSVPDLEPATATLVWHVLTALWVTIPLLVVGGVILSVVQAQGPMLAFLGALSVMLAFHGLAIPLIATTPVSVYFLHVLFAFFEDMPIAGWIWCLYHVVRLQNHIRKVQAGKESPFTKPTDPLDRVVIIGNAPTVVEGEPLGHLIDDFTHVIRFNTYTISKPEYTGVRTNYHFCNGRNFPTNDTLTAICPLFNASLTHAVYLFMPHMEEASSIYAKLTNTKVNSWFIEEEHILALRRKIGNRVWQIPTSGMVAIDAFLRKRQSVTLHGFNFFQGKKIHYFEETPTQLITSWLERFVTHDPSIEKAWVECLKAENRVILLSKDSTKVSDGIAEEQTDDSQQGSSPMRKKASDDDELRRRAPSLMHTLLKDGLPSQFSL